MKNIINAIFIGIFYIAMIGFSILSTVIYIYTVYYYAVEEGFLQAMIAFCLPVISSIFLFFTLIIEEGLFCNFALLVYAFFICVLIIICMSYKAD